MERVVKHHGSDGMSIPGGTQSPGDVALDDMDCMV